MNLTSIRARILVIVAINALLTMSISGFATNSLIKLDAEITEIAETDLVMIKLLSALTEHQLEQAVAVERAARDIALIGSTGDAGGRFRASFEKNRAEFEALDVKVNKEFKDAEALAEHVAEGSHSDSLKQEYAKILNGLLELEEVHKKYYADGLELLDVMSQSDGAPPYELMVRAEQEERILVKGLEGLLLEIETFTQTAALRAEKEERRALSILIVLSAVAIIGGTILAIFIGGRLAKALSNIAQLMGRVADKEFTIDVPYSDQDNEVGQMARALEVFRDNGAEAEQLKQSQEMERAANRQQRIESLQTMADTFETEAGTAVEAVAQRTGQMASAADGMAASSQRVEQDSQSVSAAAQQALANAEAVSTATEELSASINEIAGKINDGSVVTREAAEIGLEGREQIESLMEATGKIGEIATLINDIAEQTNLLALNATIESARAGEAGKGFAVVANEVKGLASQTANATNEISNQIKQVQDQTRSSVESVRRIVEQIEKVDQISASIAAAMKEQQAATSEIARNVTETAEAARDVARNIEHVTTEAESNRQGASEMRAMAQDVQGSIDHLKSAVVKAVRTATKEVDRRQCPRQPANENAMLEVRGERIPVLVEEISDRGARVALSENTQEPYAGEQAVLMLSGGARRAIVRQISDNCVGMEFVAA